MTFGNDRESNAIRGETGGRRWKAPIVIGAVVVLLDQITKSLIRSWLPDRVGGPTWDAGAGWVGLRYVENRGAAFGSLAGYGAVLTVVAVAVVLVMLMVYARTVAPSRWLQVGLGLLVGGAAGNVIDRLSHGFVIDFIAIGPWPRFNVADSAITVGVLLLVWRLSGDEDATAPRMMAERPAPASGDRTIDDHTPSTRTNGK